MSIHIKNAPNGYGEISQPYMKLDSSAWTPLKQVLVKTADNIWSEVWPQKIVYTHYNYGYNMNMYQCFGSPVNPAEYVFINKGYIGGSAGAGLMNIALRTGVFPPGSKLTFINEGYVSGVGGDGASFTASWDSGLNHISHATTGGSGLCLDYPTIIDNSLGYIQAGGGGGGCTGDFGGKSRYNVRGGGGAGLPGGRAGIYTWGGLAGQPGTLNAGGAAYRGYIYGTGYGGAPGQPGNHESTIINNDLSKMSVGAPGGISIFYTDFILPGSVGIVGSRILGRSIPGVPGAPFVGLQQIGLDGNGGRQLRMYVAAGGQNPIVTASIVSGVSSNFYLTKIDNNTFDIQSSRSDGYNYWDYCTVRFTVSANNGTATFDWGTRTGQDYSPPDDGGGGGFEWGSCFIAGSMVTMADGTSKPIEEIEVGDVVKTAVGVSAVYQIDHPRLNNRPLLVFSDGKCGTSAEHSMWSRKPGTNEEWWSTRDMVEWEIEALNGFGPNFEVKPFDLTDKFGQSWDFATLDGWVNTTWVRKEASPDTQLYHLLVTEGGSYYVDGYLVSSMADSGGVDWSAYRHR